MCAWATWVYTLLGACRMGACHRAGSTTRLAVLSCMTSRSARVLASRVVLSAWSGAVAVVNLFDFSIFVSLSALMTLVAAVMAALQMLGANGLAFESRLVN